LFIKLNDFYYCDKTLISILYNFRPTGDQAWVSLERIQFVGACNPPTDPGRKPLSHRFLRHVPVIYVDYPGETSLKQVNYICLYFFF